MEYHRTNINLQLQKTVVSCLLPSIPPSRGAVSDERVAPSRWWRIATLRLTASGWAWVSTFALGLVSPARNRLIVGVILLNYHHRCNHQPPVYLPFLFTYDSIYN